MKKIGIFAGAFIAVVALLVVLGGREPSSQAEAATIGPTIETSRFTREDIRFPCGNATCAGWLYLPRNQANPPVVVMGQGLTGLRKDLIPGFAETFAANGIAAFAFDYRYFGDSGGSPRNLADPQRQLTDWRAAISYVRATPEIDGDRLGLWGTSMSGGLVLELGATEENVGAIVAQIPGVDSEAERLGLQTNATMIFRVLTAISVDHVKSIYSDEAFEISTFGDPKDFAMFSDAQTMIDIEPLRQQNPTPRKIAGRSLPKLNAYNPREFWDDVNAPILIMASETDRLSPIEPIRELAEARNDIVTLELFDGHHFSLYEPSQTAWAAQRQVDFFLTKLAER
ncbi:MAG: alpha/beta hydrolase [Henriciella sp.]